MRQRTPRYVQCPEPTSGLGTATLVARGRHVHVPQAHTSGNCRRCGDDQQLAPPASSGPTGQARTEVMWRRIRPTFCAARASRPNSTYYSKLNITAGTTVAGRDCPCWGRGDLAPRVTFKDCPNTVLAPCRLSPREKRQDGRGKLDPKFFRSILRDLILSRKSNKMQEVQTTRSPIPSSYTISVQLTL